jgi:choline monooxygenase
MSAPTLPTIDADIRRAQTLPGAFYADPVWYRRQCERLFPHTWHLHPTWDRPRADEVQPWNLLAGCLDEPLLWTRGADTLHLVSNVCTHRGFVIVDRPGTLKGLRCGYHGRRFDLAGRMLGAPAFEQALDFPSPGCDLPHVPFAAWHGLLAASLAPRVPWAELVAPIEARLSWLPWAELRPAPELGRDYQVAAPWALYCDNYLEGLHIPFVHPGLNRALDWDAYETELLPHGVLQIGRTEDPAAAFSAPPGHADHGRHVAAYYWFLFPSTMINVYPWGVSVNVLVPQGPAHTRVVYLTAVWDESRREHGAGAGLDDVEHEDELVVERTARGARARLYERGRYSPTHELGVHHFHRLLLAALA